MNWQVLLTSTVYSLLSNVLLVDIVYFICRHWSHCAPRHVTGLPQSCQ